MERKKRQVPEIFIYDDDELSEYRSIYGIILLAIFVLKMDTRRLSRSINRPMNISAALLLQLRIFSLFNFSSRDRMTLCRVTSITRNVRSDNRCTPLQAAFIDFLFSVA